MTISLYGSKWITYCCYPVCSSTLMTICIYSIKLVIYPFCQLFSLCLRDAAVVMLSGQIADALATIFAGELVWTSYLLRYVVCILGHAFVLWLRSWFFSFCFSFFHFLFWIEGCLHSLWIFYFDFDFPFAFFEYFPFPFILIERCLYISFFLSWILAGRFIHPILL